MAGIDIKTNPALAMTFPIREIPKTDLIEEVVLLTNCLDGKAKRVRRGPVVRFKVRNSAGAPPLVFAIGP
jgi:hypothetical protein